MRPNSDPAWAPLRCRTYRALWLAMSVANAGAAMQAVGAQWLIARGAGHTAAAGLLVVLVQAAGMLPVLLLGLPAGILAGLVDHRRLLIGVQLGAALVGMVLAGLALSGRVPCAALLVLQCALGVGAAFTMPAYGSVVPQVLPARHLPHASALGAVSANMVRAIGPAAAGFVIARAGAWAVFAVHAVSVLAFVAVLRARCPRRVASPEKLSEPLTAAVGAGWRYVGSTPAVRRVLGQALMFLLPGSALLALLPIVAGRRLGLDASGYGLLVGALGAGAMVGAFLQPRLRTVPAHDRMAGAAGVFLLALVGVAVCRGVLTAGLMLVGAGAAWVVALACTNAAIDGCLPDWVRARGLACYQVVIFGGQGLGAVFWAHCAHRFGPQAALLLAAAVLGAGVLAGRGWPLHEPAGRRLAPQPS